MLDELGKPPIGKEEAARALQTLKRYKAGKASLEKRIVANEGWWKLRHWEQIRGTSKDAEPASAWLQNCIANKHADAMDAYPQPTVLPREQSDAAAARELWASCRWCWSRAIMSRCTRICGGTS